MTNRPHGEEGGPLSREDWQLAFDRLLSALWVLPAALEMLEPGTRRSVMRTAVTRMQGGPGEEEELVEDLLEHHSCSH